MEGSVAPDHRNARNHQRLGPNLLPPASAAGTNPKSGLTHGRYWPMPAVPNEQEELLDAGSPSSLVKRSAVSSIACPAVQRW